MIASNVSRATLDAAATAVGVSLDVRTLNAKGTRHRVKVNPGPTPDSAWQLDRKRSRLCPVCGSRVKITSETSDGRLVGTCGDASDARRWAGGARWKDERGNSKYQRTSASTFNAGRRVFAVCWHGFRDFFRAVYRVEPGAVFATAMDTWKGAEDFESRFRFSGHRNIGSQVAPMMAAEACACPESGMAV